MGYFIMFGNVAMAIGPAVGILVADSVGFAPLFWLAAAVAAVALVSSIGAREIIGPRSGPVAPLRARLFNRHALYPSAIIVCFCLSFGSVTSFLPLFAEKQRLGNPGLFFTVFAIVLIIARGPVGRLSDKYGRLAIIAPSIVVGTVALALLATATSMNTLLLVAVLYAFAFAAITPSLMAFVIDRVGPTASGSGMGTFGMAMDLGIGVGTIIWGIVAQISSYETMFFIAAISVLLGLPVIVVGKLRRL